MICIIDGIMYNYSLLLKKMDKKIYRINTCNKNIIELFGLLKGFLRFYLEGLNDEFSFNEEELNHFKQALIANNFIVRGNKTNISSASFNFLQYIIEDILQQEATKLQLIFRKHYLKNFKIGR